MTIWRSISAMAVGVCLAASASAERLDHFKGKPADTLSVALNNFSDYTQQLNRLLVGPLSDADLVQIHQLTYTLENALEKINAEFSELAEVLEEVHVASETFNRDALKENGETWRSTTAVIDTWRQAR